MKRDLTHLYAGKTLADCPRVTIRWVDIRNAALWNEEDEVRPARKLFTEGRLLYEGIDPADPAEEVVIIGGTYDAEEDTWHDVTCFPKRAFRGVLDA